MAARLVRASEALYEEEVNKKTGEIVTLKKPGDGKGIMWLMERMMPDKYAVNSKVFQARALLTFLDGINVHPTEDQVVSLIGEMFQVDAAKAANITAKALDSKDKQDALNLLKRFKGGTTNGREVRK